MKAEIIRDLDGFRGNAILVRYGAEFFAVSWVVITTGPETLVFPCDEQGEVESWGEVAGGRGMTPAEAIADLERLPVTRTGKVMTDAEFERLADEAERGYELDQLRPRELE